MGLNIGDYVLATRWSDGDPQDPWFIGFLCGVTEEKDPRYFVSDAEGRQIHRAFDRVKKIQPEVGAYLIEQKDYIECSGVSLWSHLKSARKAIVKREGDK